MFDVLVIGKGPAGLAAAAELARRGLRVGVLGPAGRPAWVPRYGAWADELRRLGWQSVAEHTWPTVEVELAERGTRRLDCAYVRVDKERLADTLYAHCDAGGARWVDGHALAVEHRTSHSVVRLEHSTVAARLVIDASGHKPALARRGDNPPPAYQTAVGMLLKTAHPFSPTHATLMDWRDGHLTAETRAGPPSFLYAMPFGEDHVFVEETVLAGRPAAPFPQLEQRLRQRLRAMNIDASAVAERERCWIPMGGPLPDLGQRVVGFGAAAGMVHPATGYLLTRVLDAAPRLGAAVEQHLGTADAHPAEAARAAWAALWPADARRRHALFGFGLECLLRLDAPQMRRFFATFFQLPPAQWSGYLNDRLPAKTLAATMARLFARAPMDLRLQLVAPALSGNGIRFATAWARSLGP